MTLKHMTIFLKVYQEQSITGAAKVLFMTQPAVTRAIKELEEFYGVRFFERLNKRLSPTEAGTRFYQEALHVMESYEHLEQEFKNWEQTGILRVGSSITLGNYALPPLTKQFQETHPKLKIKAMIANGHTLQQALLDNRLDFAMIEGGMIQKELVTAPLKEDRLMVITPRNHPLLEFPNPTLTDLVKYDLLLREKGSSSRSYLDYLFSSHGLSVSPLWESTSNQALINAVACGIGIALLPEQLVRAPILEGAVQACTLSDEPLRRQNWLVWHPNKYLTPSMEEFMELCKEFFQDGSK